MVIFRHSTLLLEIIDSELYRTLLHVQIIPQIIHKAIGYSLTHEAKGRRSSELGYFAREYAHSHSPGTS
jgi:hypothetical protein